MKLINMSPETVFSTAHLVTHKGFRRAGSPVPEGEELFCSDSSSSHEESNGLFLIVSDRPTLRRNLSEPYFILY